VLRAKAVPFGSFNGVETSVLSGIDAAPRGQPLVRFSTNHVASTFRLFCASICRESFDTARDITLTIS
jgi:hypothetical protein